MPTRTVRLSPADFLSNVLNIAESQHQNALVRVLANAHLPFPPEQLGKCQKAFGRDPGALCIRYVRFVPHREIPAQALGRKAYDGSIFIPAEPRKITVHADSRSNEDVAER